MNKLKILIAEDDESTERLLSILIEPISKNIMYARNGKEAVEIYKNNSDIDLILMDIKMPIKNGLDATREIRKISQEVVIIAQSAYALAGDKEKALGVGCNNYITKPISKKLLFSMIEQHFHHA